MINKFQYDSKNNLKAFSRHEDSDEEVFMLDEEYKLLSVDDKDLPKGILNSDFMLIHFMDRYKVTSSNITVRALTASEKKREKENRNFTRLGMVSSLLVEQTNTLRALAVDKPELDRKATLAQYDVYLLMYDNAIKNPDALGSAEIIAKHQSVKDALAGPNNLVNAIRSKLISVHQTDEFDALFEEAEAIDFKALLTDEAELNRLLQIYMI